MTLLYLRLEKGQKKKKPLGSNTVEECYEKIPRSDN